MIDEYNKIRVSSKEDWLFVLNSEKTNDKNIFDILIFIYNCANYRTNCGRIAEYLKTNVGTINVRVSHFGKRVLDLLKLPEIPGETGQNRRWNIPFMTDDEKNEDNYFYWILRPELIEAMNEFFSEKELELYKEINELVIGNIYSNNTISSVFKCSNMGGMRRSKLTNSLVLITKHQEKRAGNIYEDEWTEDGILNYTGMGTSGDQSINFGQNKTLAIAKKEGIKVYLFESFKDNEYYFDGEVEIAGPIFQADEKDVDGNIRKVIKYPLRKISQDEDVVDEQVQKVSYDIVQISAEIKSEENGAPIFKEGSLEIRKYNNVEEKKKNIRTSKPDYIAEEIIKTKQGEINEKAIYEYELQKMMELEAVEEVKRMEDFFKNKKENEGYDILSFELDESGEYIEKYIEVKSTKGPESTPIDITDNEIDFATKHKDQYFIYRIFNSNKPNCSFKIVTGKELFEKFRFVPTAYKIYKAS